MSGVSRRDRNTGWLGDGTPYTAAPLRLSRRCLAKIVQPLLHVPPDGIPTGLAELGEEDSEEVFVGLGAVDDDTFREKRSFRGKSEQQFDLALQVTSIEVVRDQNSHPLNAYVTDLEDIEESAAHDLDLDGVTRGWSNPDGFPPIPQH